jgi:histidinol-phosphate aminotransferase
VKTPSHVIRDEIRALKGYNVADASGMLKLDAMENPYRLPEVLRAKIAEVVAKAEINRYPDAAGTRLKASLRDALGIHAAAQIVLGNGSDEIIQMLTLATARPGATMLGVEPSFVMFRLIAAFCGMRYVGVPLTADFGLDAQRMISAIEEHQPPLVFIAYPNNPTGNLFDADAIERVLAAAPGIVVIDEAYHAFAGSSWLPVLAERPNLLVMRTLSKSGLAGLRLGLVAGAADVLTHIDKVRLPYNVNVLTQLVAEEVLRHRSLLDDQAAAIRTERARLRGELGRIRDVTPFPSDANFVLFRTRAPDAIFDGLMRRRVLVKNVHGSHPLLDGCLRVTVGTAEENDRFLAALRESIAD